MKVNGQRNGILVVSEVRGDTRRYRALHLIEQLQLLGVPCEFNHMAHPEVWEAVKKPWKMVVFHRVAHGKHVDQMLEQLRRHQPVIFSDFDDMNFDVSAFEFINSPDFADPVRSQLYRQNMGNIRKTLEIGDGALASTHYLAEQIRQAGKRTWVHRNAFNLEMLSRSEAARKKRSAPGSERIVIGYASGTPTHNRDFEQIKPVLIEVMNAYQHVVLRLIGPLDPGEGWGQLAERIERVGLVPWRQLPELLASFDINLAPLVLDNPFAQSKSEIKFMEAAMVETPTIASPTDAFRFAIRSGETGFLAESAEEWKHAISQLVEDGRLRRSIARQAYESVHRDYHPVSRAQQLAVTLEEVSTAFQGQPFWQQGQPSRQALEECAAGHSRLKEWMPRRYEQDPSNVRLGLYSLRRKGLKTLVKEVWIYIRRLVSPIFPFKNREQA